MVPEVKKKISVLVPCYNEADSLPLLLSELEKVAQEANGYDWEYIFVNDGSEDETLLVLQQLRESCKRVNYLDLSRNYGKEIAMMAGIDFCSADCLVILDADLQHPPKVILQMIPKWEAGYDDIYAKRLTRGKEPFLRRCLSVLYYKILNKSTRQNVLPNVGDFRLLDKKCIDALKQLRENNRYTKGMFCYIGFRKTFVEFETQERVAGESSMSYKSLLNLAIEGILSYTIAPLRVATFVGGITSIIAFLYSAFVFIKALISGDPVKGFPTLLIVILLLGGLQLMSLGIIGEYLGRVFIETKGRPSYYIRSINE